MFIVFLGGILGGLARLGLGEALPKWGGFPLGTLLINLAGCFAFALVVKQWLLVKGVHEKIILGVGTGFLGAFTTFSSAILDMVNLGNSHHYILLILYTILEIGGGLGMAILGIWLGRKWVHP